MNSRLHKYIRVGLLTMVAPASALLFAGVILILARPEAEIGQLPLCEVFSGIPKLDPASFLSLGMLALFLSPVLGALAALAAFVAEKDKRGVLATLAVIAVIAISVFLRPK